LRISALWPGLERIYKSYSFCEIDLKNFGKKFALEGVEAVYIARKFCFIYSYLKSCVCFLLVAVTLPVTSASCERSFLKLTSENISQKFHDQ